MYSFLCVLRSSPCRASESRAVHDSPVFWLCFPCLRKGEIFFFKTTDLIVIFKLFLYSLPLSHCFSSFHSCFFLSLFFFFLSPSWFFFAVFRSVFSKARERRFVSSSRVMCEAMTLTLAFIIPGFRGTVLSACKEREFSKIFLDGFTEGLENKCQDLELM